MEISLKGRIIYKLQTIVFYLMTNYNKSKCGGEPGGKNVKEFGVCPVVKEIRLDGIHGWKKAEGLAGAGKRKAQTLYSHLFF